MVNIPQAQHTSPYAQPNDEARLQQVWKMLERVFDPEIPSLNVIELGIIADVRVHTRNVEVDMTPTFVGCPALDRIRDDITQTLESSGEHGVIVNVVRDPAWTSDRITPEGRRKLKEFGLAPPGPRCSGGETPNLEHATCPFCNSIDTQLESIFGPTLCRSIHYCQSCLQSFEQFKPV